MLSYEKPAPLNLKGHPEYNEKWVQDLIKETPSILGLGDLELRDSERKQPSAGRLDLLLEDQGREPKRRYEVELQLGATDETHIIRSTEYWDIERKRYPQYDHCAVLVAEDITSRFLNVISLFNGTIPFIAIQMQALQVADHITLVFIKVMDELVRGDEDEDTETEPKTRESWEKSAAKKTVGLADEILKTLKSFDESLELNYTKSYIGLSRNDQPFNFVKFIPRKSQIILQVKLPKTDEFDEKIKKADLETLEYISAGGYYQLGLTQNDVETKDEVLRELMSLSHEQR